MFSLTFTAVAAAGLEARSYAAASLHILMQCVLCLWDASNRQPTCKNPSRALEGTEAIALTTRRSLPAHSQAPSPPHPRPLADRNEDCNYQYMPVSLKAPCGRQICSPKGYGNARLLSSKNEEGETRSSPWIAFGSRPPSPLRYEIIPCWAHNLESPAIPPRGEAAV
ncbi:hypothetical protein BJ322DRAFT_345923 [Thelephora terrestris]|uniref:Uncharacterized protein n=1 Tax=Thelephora terrestris TaxID=56493 RepID=A0A9P6H5H9_9AGAM|nr:hypothetical protein BJ322DRAFT_345923 [Thelephora terrestris]